MWFDSRAYCASGKLVADMRMMLRQPKQSSPLVPDPQLHAAPVDQDVVSDQGLRLPHLSHFAIAHLA